MEDGDDYFLTKFDPLCLQAGELMSDGPGHVDPALVWLKPPYIETSTRKPAVYEAMAPTRALLA